MADIEKVEKFNKSYFKMFRSFLTWEWYDDTVVKSLFLHCLLSANFKEKNWHGQIIKPGQFVTSLPKLAHSLNFTIQRIRTAIFKLKSTKEITVYSTSVYSIITVNNWEQYQENNMPFNMHSTVEQQSSNSRATTTNNEENEKNDKYILSLQNFKNENPTFKFWGELENVGLTEKQYCSLQVMIMNTNKLNQYIEELSENIATKKELEFDFKFPDMHKIRIKKYWINDKNKKRTQQTVKTETKRKTASQMTDEERNAQIIKELTESGENPDEYFD